MNILAKFIFCTVIIFFYSNKIFAKSTWILDKKLSEIKFEVPIFLPKKVQGQFSKFDGYVVIE